MQSVLVVICVICLGYLMINNFKTSKVVYIDSNALLKGYKGYIDASLIIDKKNDSLKQVIDTLAKSWENDITLYEKERTSLSEKKQKEKELELKTKQYQIGQFQEVQNGKLEKKSNEIKQSVFNEINLFIVKYGKENNYSVIYGANGNGSFLYMDTTMNITKSVLEALNKQYAKK